MSEGCKLINTCRCCLSNDCYKDISSEYFFSGLTEVYSEMLLQTFNIEISFKEGGGPSSSSRLICDPCIRRLRDATEFRSQVLRAEENITRYLNGFTSSDVCKPIVPKSEDVHLQDYLDDNFNDFAENVQTYPELLVKEHYSDADVKQEYNLISLENDNGSTSTSSDVQKRDRAVRKKETKASSKEKRKQMKKTGSPRKSSTSETNLRKNTEKLIANSNMCLFKSLKTKYQCVYCSQAFLQVVDLRAHTSTHTQEDIKRTHIRTHFKCAEITDLRCKLCEAYLTDIDELKTHLTQKHTIHFNDDTYALIPYKITEEFKCVICLSVFQSFLRLSIHMHTHYSNHVCEQCGASYINKSNLRLHIHTIHRERKCTKCDVVCKTSKDRLKHYRSVHKITAKWKRYCQQCEKTFKYTYLLESHMIREHGAPSKRVECKDCAKSFKSPYYLRVHVRSVHLRERNHECALCPMRFFTKTDRVRHEKSHGVSEENMISCLLCSVRFKSKDSLRRHARKQHAKDS